MPDVVTYCRSGVPILNGGVVVGATELGVRDTMGASGINQETASQTYTRLENQYTNRFDDPRYYTGDAAT